jgi:hypothetical protein
MQPKALKDKDGRIICFRVIVAAWQEIVPTGTVVCQRNRGDAVELRLFADGSTQIRKFLPPPGNLGRLLGVGGTP